ncbi:sensor histidine kinase [Azospirillum canadense]|uniref:sensor histidine kinase n=1 Tax=Azospirillum canadense TaxID=403962 RepID=UPI0022270E5A|nr:sensor histidine kinase [Azospirillum canadense]MCW2241861.1 two-component sensor histidine kinase [Azospirillum canadense]
MTARHNISSCLLRIVIVALASMALIAMGLVAWNMASQRRFAETEMVRTVRAIAVALDQQLLVTTTALESLGMALAEDDDPARLYRIAQGVMTKHPYWSHVTLRDAAGTMVFTTAMPYGAPMPTTNSLAPLLDEVLAADRPQVSNLLRSSLIDSPVAAVGVPVQAKDGKRFVLIAVVTVSKWEKFLQNQELASSWVAGIIDRTGIVIARTRAAEQFVGKPAPGWVREAIQTAPEGRAEGPALEGGALTLAFSRSAVSGWTVAFAAPSSVFETPLRRSLWLAAAVSLGALGVAALLVRRYARRLSRSVAGLARIVEAIQEPGAVLPPLPHTDVAEVASVYDSVRCANVHLREAEERRTTAMRELQHRVKNDLQAILSLIALESGQTSSTETRRILEELQGRVEALRLVHSRLYEASQVGTVELGSYLRELCGNSVALYGRSLAGELALKVSVGAVYVDHNAAVSLGLIANEFVTNSAKHAFPHGAGTITLELDVPAAGPVRLRLADNGIGMPANRTRSSGLQLIAMLAEQIGAAPEWEVNAGTSLRLSFSVQGAGLAG